MVLILLWLCHAFISRGEPGNFHWDNWFFISGSWPYTRNPSPVMTFLRKSGSLVAVWIKSLTTAAQCSFCSGGRSWRTNFATTCFMPRSCIKISDTVVFGIPRSDSSSPTITDLYDCSPCTLNILRCSACCRLPERGSLSTHSWPSLKHLCHTFICAALGALSPKAFWIIRTVSTEECSSLTQNLMEIHCCTHSFWMQPRSTHAPSMASTAPTD